MNDVNTNESIVSLEPIDITFGHLIETAIESLAEGRIFGVEVIRKGGDMMLRYMPVPYVASPKIRRGRTLMDTKPQYLEIYQELRGYKDEVVEVTDQEVLKTIPQGTRMTLANGLDIMFLSVSDAPGLDENSGIMYRIEYCGRRMSVPYVTLHKAEAKIKVCS